MARELQCVWMMFADEVTQDRGLMTFRNVREGIAASKVPWKPEVLYVVTFWRGEPGTRFHFSLRITGPERFLLEVPATRGLAQIAQAGSYEIVVLDNITFPKYWQYLFSVVSDHGAILFSEPFDVVKG